MLAFVNEAAGTNAMTDQIWILVIMAGIAVLLALVALILFTPPRPAVPSEGPVQISVAPFKDLEPDPANMYMGDNLAAAFVQSLSRYGRIDASVSEEPNRFVAKGDIRKSGQRFAVQVTVTSGGRHFWRRRLTVKETEAAAAVTKAADALARQMRLSLK